MLEHCKLEEENQGIRGLEDKDEDTSTSMVFVLDHGLAHQLDTENRPLSFLV